jgi:hypothetical protein
MTQRREYLTEAAMTQYDALIADALADVEADERHPCGTEHCQEMSGCPRCLAALMKGDIGVRNVAVFVHNQIIRIRTTGCDGKPCVISFHNVPLTIRD